jgi:hypothetical protein
MKDERMRGVCSSVLRLPSNLNERKRIMETEKKLQVKKEWKTPELIVLVRSKPEEAVLTGCKYAAVFGGASTAVNGGCWYQNYGDFTCYHCSVAAPS